MAAPRGSLRDFQENLARRLAGAGAHDSLRSRLAVESGGKLWLLQLPDAGEVMPVPWLCKVPLTKRWYCGIVNVRGSLYGMIDFADFCSAEPTRRHAENALVLCGQRFGLNAGLLVQKVVGLRNAQEFKAIEGAVGDKPWIAGLYQDHEDRRYQELHVERLLLDPAFLDIGMQDGSA